MVSEKGVFAVTVISTAVRSQIWIGAVTASCFAALLALAVAVGDTWEAVSAASFVVMGLLTLLRGLTNRIDIDQRGVVANRLPLRSVRYSWSQVDHFAAGKRGTYLVRARDEHRVLLLEFGKLRSQLDERTRALQDLESARSRSCRG